MDLYVAGTLAFAALFGLWGRNAQAQLSRDKLLDDSDSQIVEAGRVWTPTRWFARPSTRHKRNELEAKLRKKPRQWHRYQTLVKLWAWNALQSSVALAFVASLVAAIQIIVD